MRIHKSYTFDDIILMPKYSDLDSRYSPDISFNIGDIDLSIPIISSPMDTVTEHAMATFMAEEGGIGIIHRYNSIEEQCLHVKRVKELGLVCGAAIGVNGDSWERTGSLISVGADVLVLDVAHGHNRATLERAARIKKNFPDTILVSGNIATYEAAAAYADIGVDALRVGIGPGSSCTTRMVAGVGVPQLTAIESVVSGINFSKKFIKSRFIPIISDGGIKNSGDIVKALAAGASAVMIGGLLAPFNISAGKKYYKVLDEKSPVADMFGIEGDYMRRVYMKSFRGMASEAALSEWKHGETYLPEGENFEVPVRYDHREFLSKLTNGVKAGLSYIGAKNIKELWSKAEFFEVSPNGYLESLPHFGRVDRE